MVVNKAGQRQSTVNPSNAPRFRNTLGTYEYFRRRYQVLLLYTTYRLHYARTGVPATVYLRKEVHVARHALANAYSSRTKKYDSWELFLIILQCTILLCCPVIEACEAHRDIIYVLFLVFFFFFFTITLFFLSVFRKVSLAHLQ